MPKITESLTDVIESGRQLPYLSKSLPTDEALTEALLKAGFTHRFGVPYSAPDASRPEKQKDIRIWPAPKRKKPANYMTGKFPRRRNEI